MTTHHTFNILFDNDIRRAVSDLTVLFVDARGVANNATDNDLWRLIEDECHRIQATYPMDRVKNRPGIAATRTAYKACGKEPNRYRPSAEALCRRAVKGESLYRTTTLVDLINLVSLQTGYSIGGFDADKVQGDTLTLGVGREGEPYEAIGRGPLNIAGLPVFRDAIGGIGTPTSDNDRTKLSPDTTRIIMTVNIYGPAEDIDTTRARIADLLARYAGATDIDFSTYHI